jgi:hypothetical protein
MADGQPVPEPTPAATEESSSVIDLDASVPPTARRPRRRLLPVLVAAGVTLAVLLGIGGFVTYQRLAAGKRPPEEFTPASVAIFASLDLTVGRDQVARLADVLGRLDQNVPAGASGADALKSLLARLPLEKVNVERDIASWLGARLAVSVWFDERQRPFPLISAATTDDGRARAALERIKAAGNEIGFVVESGAALVVLRASDAQAAAEAAAAAARAAPLDALASFREAKRWLGDGHLLTLWGDAGRYATAMAQSSSGPEPRGHMYGVTIPEDTSTSIAGVRATEDGFEARYREFGSSAPSGEPGNAVARLADLPAGTEYGAVQSLPEGPLWTLGSPIGGPYGGFIGLLAGNLTFGWVPLFGPLGPEEIPAELTNEEQAEVDRLLAKDPTTLTKAESGRLEELIGFSPDEAEAPPRELTGAEQAEVERLLTKDPTTLTKAESARLKELIGFSPGDAGLSDGLGQPFGGFAGATITIAVTGLGREPDVHMVAEAASAKAADAVASDLRAGRGETVTVEGTVVTMTSARYTAGAGRLGDDPMFQRLLRGAPTRTDLALYADLASVAAPGRFQTFKVGLALGVEDGEYVGLVRLVTT